MQLIRVFSFRVFWTTSFIFHKAAPWILPALQWRVLLALLQSNPSSERIRLCWQSQGKERSAGRGHVQCDGYFGQVPHPASNPFPSHAPLIPLLLPVHSHSLKGGLFLSYTGSCNPTIVPLTDFAHATTNHQAEGRNKKTMGTSIFGSTLKIRSMQVWILGL